MKVVLFVDDEPALLTGFRMIFRPERTPWRSLFAGSGPEALGVLASEHVDLIVSDLRMPGMDGATLLEQAAQLSPHTRRIILSGYADPALHARAKAVCELFLAKPCPATELRKALEATLAPPP